MRGFYTDPARADDSFIPFSTALKSLTELAYKELPCAKNSVLLDTFTPIEDCSVVLIMFTYNPTTQNLSNTPKTFWFSGIDVEFESEVFKHHNTDTTSPQDHIKIVKGTIKTGETLNIKIEMGGQASYCNIGYMLLKIN